MEEPKPTITQLDRRKLPPALAMMVDYTETAPWEEVLEEVHRQWPQTLLREDLDQVEARSKLAGLILGAALGVTLLPNPEPKFPALLQALELARMTTKARERQDRERKAKAARVAERRKARKAKRRISKRTR